MRSYIHRICAKDENVRKYLQKTNLRKNDQVIVYGKISEEIGTGKTDSHTGCCIIASNISKVYEMKVIWTKWIVHRKHLNVKCATMPSDGCDELRKRHATESFIWAAIVFVFDRPCVLTLQNSFNWNSAIKMKYSARLIRRKP